MTMRRVVLFDAYPHVYGGAQRTDHLLARLLPSRGWQLVTLTTGEGPFTERLAADGLPMRIVPPPAALARYGRATTGARRLLGLLVLPVYWRRLARALRDLQPEVVHIVDHRGLVLAGVPARRSGARVVWHVQALDRTRALNRFGARIAHCIVVPTLTVVPKLAGIERAADVRAVANVVPDHARRAVPTERTGSPIVVTTGRLHPDKGLDLLIQALALTRAEVPGARLRIVGGPQEGFEHLTTALRAEAAHLGLADALEMVGFVERPDEILASAACYVQAARERTEILPLAILEAMAAGLPVVATDVGGVADLVQDGVTGLLVPPEDPVALAAAVTRVLVDRELGDRLGAAAFARASERRFSEAGLVDGVLDAYERRSGG